MTVYIYVRGTPSGWPRLAAATPRTCFLAAAFLFIAAGREPRELCQFLILTPPPLSVQVQPIPFSLLLLLLLSLSTFSRFNCRLYYGVFHVKSAVL